MEDNFRKSGNSMGKIRSFMEDNLRKSDDYSMRKIWSLMEDNFSKITVFKSYEL